MARNFGTHAAPAAEAARAVEAAIKDMPGPYREVFELRLLQALPNDAIAARLQRAPGVIRTQLWRALEMLRQVLPKGLALSLAAQLVMRPAACSQEC